MPRWTPLLTLPVLLCLATACGTDQPPRTAASPSDVSLPPGQTWSCPPVSTPPKGGRICVGVPKPCAPRPCGQSGRLVVKVTGYEPWTGSDGARGYRFGWRIENPGGEPVTFDLLDLNGEDMSSVVDMLRQARSRDRCVTDRPGARIPRDGVATSPHPVCVPVEKNKHPEEIDFHFAFGSKPDGPQTTVTVPLTEAARLRAGPGT